jgi:hypothetical protein
MVQPVPTVSDPIPTSLVNPSVASYPCVVHNRILWFHLR